jgi:hypothetical protein
MRLYLAASPVPGCGGFVCPCSDRCNRAESFDPAGHEAAKNPAKSGPEARLAAEMDATTGRF